MPSGSSNALATTSGSNMHTQHVPKPSSVACIIIWSTTIDVSMSEAFIPSYERTQASSSTAHAMSTTGAPNMLPSRAKRGAASAAFSSIAGVVHAMSRVGWLLCAEGAMRPASITALSTLSSTGRS